MLDTKRRYIPFNGPTTGKLTVIHKDSIDPSVNSFRSTETLNGDSFASLGGIQVTESENHAFYKHRPGVWKGDLGGPFYSLKKYMETSHSSAVHIFNEKVEYPLWFYPEWTVTDIYSYSGPLLPLSPNLLEYPPSAASSKETLDTIGGELIARCSPSNASVDLAVALGELLKDGIPHLIGATLKGLRDMTTQARRRALGQEYLNVEFGWKPFVSDLVKLSHTIVAAQSILDQYEQNSGNLVRRKYALPQLTTSATQVALTDCSPWNSPGSAGLYDQSMVNKGKVIRSHNVTIDRWFSGAFTYYVPPSDSLRNDIARHVIQARRLLGLSLTPDTIWNLTPWSWAIDWFFNVGDVLKNWTDWAIDNQVLRYGYMMEKSISKYTYTFVGPSGFHGGVQPPSVSTVCSTKMRQKATPYGFGLTWDGFSARQLSIVAALGISRS